MHKNQGKTTYRFVVNFDYDDPRLNVRKYNSVKEAVKAAMSTVRPLHGDDIIRIEKLAAKSSNKDAWKADRYLVPCGNTWVVDLDIPTSISDD